MTRSEKFEKIADAVYDKGKTDFGTLFDVTGTDAIEIKNVHPKKHDVDIELSSQSDAVVSGKNLFRMTQSFSVSSNGLTVDYDYDTQIFTINGTSINTVPCFIDTNLLRLCLQVGKIYTVSIKYISGTESAENGYIPRFYLGIGSTPTERNNWIDAHLAENDTSRTMSCTKPYFSKLWIYCGAATTFENYKFKAMLEQSDTSTGYEDFTGEIYSPDENGSFIAKSISPTMNISSLTSGVSIRAKGYLDGQAVIDELTQAIVDLGGEI